MRDNNFTMNFRIIPFLVFFLLALPGFAQIKAVEQFLKEHPGLSAYYVYQSTLRMINLEDDPDFNRLIRHVRKINTYVANDPGTVSNATYQKLLSALHSDDFEVLVNVKHGASMMYVMGRERGSQANYILTHRDEERFILMEMDGALDLRYIRALNNVNFSRFTESILGQ